MTAQVASAVLTANLQAANPVGDYHSWLCYMAKCRAEGTAQGASLSTDAKLLILSENRSCRHKETQTCCHLKRN